MNEPSIGAAETGGDDELLARLADDFTHRRRAGERPAIEDYAAAHPALADRIRELFPAILAMEQTGAVPATVDPAPATERVGAIIDRYKLLERIGEGGFGVVYMAEQQQPVRRKVALKVIKPGVDTGQVIARFEAERQALALMDHDNIAKVLDAGATDSGRPYFVMELVCGVPITEYCDRNELSPRQRLELFVQVCRAVQHAHTKGIIHRDLKPTNVLVTLHDGGAVPKVIDFGVAKATGQQLTEKTLFTNFAQMVGTPLYMSPEQAEMTSVDVDTRSDVYSLGVLLYELLTGTTPLDKDRLKTAAFDEIRRIIREDDPPKPSTRLSTTAALASISARRHTQPAKLTKLVRGELDWIVMKALEKDRNRRYETASGFAADVQRYLADEPVVACPPSAAYKFRKFARRNKRMLVTATLLGAMLLVLAGSFGWMARSSAAQRFRNAEAVAALLEQCEEALRADRADRAAIALEAAERRAADGGADDLAGRLARCRADLRLLRELDAINTFCWTWAGDSFPDREALVARWSAAFVEYGAVPEVTPALDTAERIKGSLIHNRLLTALDAWLVFSRSAWVRDVLRSADPDAFRDSVRDAVGSGETGALAALVGRPEALAQPARFAVILGQFRGVAADRRRAVLESALRTQPGNLELLMALGESYPFDGRVGTVNSREVGERVRWFQAAVAAHPENVAAWTNLGVSLEDLDGAIACFEEALRLDPTFRLAHCNIGITLQEKGQIDAAIAAYRKSIDLHPDYVPAHYQLGYALMKKGDLDGAKAAFNAAIRLDPNNPEPHYHLGLALQETGHLDGAIEAYRKAIEVDRRHIAAHSNLGGILCDVKRDYDGAVTAFTEAIRLAPQEALYHRNLANALLGKGELDRAIAAYKEAIQRDPHHAPAHNGLGYALRDKGNMDGAIKAFRDAIWADPNFAQPYLGLGDVLHTLGDASGAAASFREVIRINPNFAGAHNALAWLLATGQDGVRDGKQAVVHAERACELTQWKDPNCIDTLAAAHAEAGDFDRAVEFQKKALTFPDFQKADGTGGQERLELYERKMPYRDPVLALRDQP